MMISWDSEICPDIERLEWISQSLHIIDKRGHFTRLIPNNGQLMLHAEIQQQRARGLPVRIVLLKPRQVGWTTWTEAEAFYDVYHKANINAMAVSVDADSTDVVFGMTKRFHSAHPKPLPTDNTNRKAIIFSEPHRSAFYAQTAGKVGVGRSFQARFLHNSEVAFWSDAATQLAGVYQMVPEDEGTCVILESTGNGVGGAFYDTYMEAKERAKTGDLRGYRPVFFPWSEFSEYAIEPPEGFSLTRDEKELKRQFRLSNAQIYWRRLKIQELNGRIEVFKQEYPLTDIEAFQTSGSPVFDPGTISFQEKHLRTDVQYGLFDYKTGSWMPNQGGSRYGWQYLDHPGSSEHVIGVDTREHRLTDEKDPKSQRDNDGIVVLERKAGIKRVKAIFRGKMAQKDLGLQVLGAAKHFNQAWVVPEIPQGMMVLQTLVQAGYPHIYARRTKEDTYDPDDLDSLGYRTTSATRHMLVNESIPYLRSQQILLQFREFVDEMRVFIYDKMGKAIHMPGKHDDLLLALFLAIQGYVDCPQAVKLVDVPAFTGETDGDWRRPERTADDLAYSGAIDDFEYDDDMDEDAWYMTS